MYKAVIPECNIDTCLINVLLNAPNKNGVNHGKGRSSVTKKMESEFLDRFSIGIIDKDEEDIDYVKNECYILNETIKEYSILHKHYSRHHYVIQICPESEKWICKVTAMVGINLHTEHQMPDKWKDLERLTKNTFSKNDPKFIKLFKHIVAKSEQTNFEPVLKLRKWLRLLIDKNYNVDINELMK